MILGIQIIGILFALFMIYFTFINKKRKEFTLRESVFWFLIWGIFMILIIIPTSLNYLIKNTLGFYRVLDFFIIIGFFFLILINYYTYLILRKTQKKMEYLVRKMAIEKETPKNGN